MQDILRKLNVLLDKKQKKTMILMVFMMIFGAILEACSVSMVIPMKVPLALGLLWGERSPIR